MAFAAIRSEEGGFVGVRAEELPSVSRVVSFSNPGLAADGRIENGALQLRGSLALATATYLNLDLAVAAHTPEELPRLYVRAGTVRFSPAAVRWLSNMGVGLIWPEPFEDAPRLSDLIEEVRVGEDFAAARIDMPIGLLRAAQRLAGRYSPDADAAARATYLRLTNFEDSFRRPASLGGLFAQAFPQDEDTVSPEEASGRLVGMIMAAYDPDFLRLVDVDAQRNPPCRGERVVVTVVGRRDLALHLLISAIFSAQRDRELGSALGEMKELSDALPGGSGFSFVDLAADRAGIRLGTLLADPKTTAEVQRHLGRGGTANLFPARALGMEEGLSEEEFERRFGRLNSEQYEAAVDRIDAALDSLPIYQDFTNG
ncbi:hypothetical protein B5C34_01445 [Pacificimonas flava]|uniref:Uncharacterized protein n=2 Tax=Pacificimonas TaxID=1960290 RepID=A0A219B292_9SPHN|nr:hypothetical protein B5C34_01445 [Pacificimonas flava]